MQSTYMKDLYHDRECLNKMNENCRRGSCSSVDDQEEKFQEVITEEITGATFRDVNDSEANATHEISTQIQMEPLMPTTSQEVQEISHMLQAMKSQAQLFDTQQFTEFSSGYEQDNYASSSARRLLDMSAKLRRIGEQILEKEKGNYIELLGSELGPTVDGIGRTSARVSGPDPPCHPRYDAPGYEPSAGASVVDYVEQVKSIDELEKSLETILDRSCGPFAYLFTRKTEVQKWPQSAIHDPPGEDPCAPQSAIHDPPGEDPCADVSIMGYLNEGTPFLDSRMEELTDEYLSLVGLDKRYNSKEFEFPNDEIPNTPVYFSIDTSDCDASVEVILAESYDDESFYCHWDRGISPPDHSGPPIILYNEGTGISSTNSDDIRIPAFKNNYSDQSRDQATDESCTSTTAFSSSESGHCYKERGLEFPSSSVEQPKRNIQRNNFQGIQNLDEREKAKMSAYERLQVRSRTLHSKAPCVDPDGTRQPTHSTSNAIPHVSPLSTKSHVTLSLDLRKRQLDKALAERVGAIPVGRIRTTAHADRGSLLEARRDRIRQDSRESLRAMPTESSRRDSLREENTESTESKLYSKQRERSHHQAPPMRKSPESRTNEHRRQRETTTQSGDRGIKAGALASGSTRTGKKLSTGAQIRGVLEKAVRSRGRQSSGEGERVPRSALPPRVIEVQAKG